MVNFTRTKPWTLYPKPGVYVNGFVNCSLGSTAAAVQPNGLINCQKTFYKTFFTTLHPRLYMRKKTSWKSIFSFLRSFEPVEHSHDYILLQKIYIIRVIITKLVQITAIDSTTKYTVVHPYVWYVFLCELRGPAWAVGSYSIGPPAKGLFQKHSTVNSGELQFAIEDHVSVMSGVPLLL